MYVKRLTKAETLHLFAEHGQAVLSRIPTYKGDSIAKREEWNDYTDGLCRDQLISQRQRDNWTNPF